MSLIELMIAITLGILVSGVAIALLTSTLGSNSSNLRYTRINQDLRSTMNAIAHDLTRAGYWGVAAALVQSSSQNDLSLSGTSGTVTVIGYKRGTQTLNNTFAAPFTNTILQNRTLVLLIGSTRYDLTIASRTDNDTLSATIPTGVTLPAASVRAGSWTILNPFNGITVNTAGNCVVMSYDLNDDGVKGADESFGYQRNATSGTIDATSAGAACGTTTNWSAITDDRTVQITGFSVTEVAPALTAANQLNARVKEYIITLNGQLRSDSQATRSLREAIKVRNNEFY